MDEPNATPDPGSVFLDLFGPHTTDEDLQVKETIFPQVEIDPPGAEEAKDKSLCLCLHDEGVGGTSSAVVNKCTCDSDSKVYPKSGSTVDTVEESDAVLESKVVVDCVSATSENELLLQEIQYVCPPSNEFGSCKGDETDLRTNICSENPNQDGALLEPHDRSDGSDSGLGSELAEELVASAQADCSIDDLCIQITRHVAEQKKSLFLNNSEGRSAEMQPQPVSNPVVSNNEGNQVSNTLDVKTPTSDYDTQTETSELSLDDDVTNKLSSESINLGIMPNRASEHNGSSMAANVFPQELADMENIVSKEQSASEHGNEEECERKELQTALRSTLKRTHSESICDEPRPKKKKSISFDSVSVYYFPRTQGFTCVPSQGGSTLGMAQEHSHIHRFSISEHAVEQRRVHRQMMLQLRHERLSQGLPPTSSSSSTTGGGVHISSSEDSDSEEEPSDASESELDVDSYYFLQPVPTRQRRALLRAAGVHRIDSVEKDECKDIRSSREMCGCACKTYCDPDTCSCSQSGIKCQVDRVNFPCGCSRDGCANTSGRIEFNPMRVRTHFIHTLMRLELEKKQRAVEEDSAQREQTTWGCSGPSLRAATGPATAPATAPSEQSKFPEVPTATPAGNEGEQPTNFPASHYGPDREDSLDLYRYPFSEESKNAETLTLPYSNLRKPHVFAPAPPNQESFPFSQEAAPAVHPFNSSTTTAHGYPFNYPNTSGLSHDNQYGRQQQFAGFSLFNSALPSVCSFNYSSVYNQEFPAKPQIGTDVFENGAFKAGEYMNQNGNNNGDCYNFPVGGAVTGSAASGEESSKGPAPALATAAPSAVVAAAAAAAGTQYTNLHTVCQLGSNKLEPFSGLLQGRYPYLTPASSSEAGESASAATPMPMAAPTPTPMDQACSHSQMQVDAFRSEGQGRETANGEAATDANADADKGDDCSDENFGEIIKKTMVETVSA